MHTPLLCLVPHAPRQQCQGSAPAVLPTWRGGVGGREAGAPRAPHVPVFRHAPQSKARPNVTKQQARPQPPTDTQPAAAAREPTGAAQTLRREPGTGGSASQRGKARPGPPGRETRAAVLAAQWAPSSRDEQDAAPASGAVLALEARETEGRLDVGGGRLQRPFFYFCRFSSLPCGLPPMRVSGRICQSLLVAAAAPARPCRSFRRPAVAALYSVGSAVYRYSARGREIWPGKQVVPDDAVSTVVPAGSACRLYVHSALPDDPLEIQGLYSALVHSTVHTHSGGRQACIVRALYSVLCGKIAIGIGASPAKDKGRDKTNQSNQSRVCAGELRQWRWW